MSVAAVDWDLVVPQAVAQGGRIVTPREVGRKDGPFACPECDGEVVWRAGPEVRRHFAHTPDSPCALVQTGESWWHRSAKKRVAQVVSDWLERGEDEPKVEPVLCGHCAAREITATPLGDLALGVVAVRTEARFDGLSVIPDVALLDAEGEMVLAVELVRTHAMEEAKMAAYRAAGIEWLEIDATRVLDGGPVWRPFRTSRSPGGRCVVCGSTKGVPKPEHAYVRRVDDGPHGKEGLEKMVGEVCARIDQGDVASPLGPLCTPPVRLDRKSVRYMAVIRDRHGRRVAAYEDAEYARAMVDAMNRVAEHFEARRTVPMGGRGA